MSFSSDTKAELCKDEFGQKCCIRAEAYGVLLYCNTFSENEVRIVTGCRPFAERLVKLFKKAFNISFDSMPQSFDGSGKLQFFINDSGKLDRIFQTYGYDRADLVAQHVNFGVFNDDICRQSFLRGAFLAGGSVTDPKKAYHLEIVTDHYTVSRETFSLILDMGFEPKETVRGGNYITYFKQSEVIEDFLTTIGAPVSAMEIMSAKILKDVTNSVNRRVNCDTANVTKTVEAAQEQLNAIRHIEETTGIESLPEKLRQTAMLRIENPELSISELAELFDPPVTKSGLSHRLRKLVKIGKGEA